MPAFQCFGRTTALTAGPEDFERGSRGLPADDDDDEDEDDDMLAQRRGDMSEVKVTCV